MLKYILEHLNKISENIEKNEEYKFISNKINFESLNSVGYNSDLIKKLDKIKDKKLAKILKRNLRECAISYISMQYKSTQLLGGSIIEAILTSKLKENGYTNTSITDKNGKNNVIPLERMELYQLLSLALEKK